MRTGERYKRFDGDDLRREIMLLEDEGGVRMRRRLEEGSKLLVLSFHSLNSD